MRTKEIDTHERERIVHELGTTFLVEAGAGTGKTTLLLARLLTMIRLEKAELREIVAITFTKKAAAELTIRLRGKIMGLCHDNDVNDNDKALYKRTLHRLDEIRIDTIHAFAASLLRERPVEARLDPEFVSMDDQEEKDYFARVWEQWLWEQIEGRHGALLQVFFAGISQRQLSRMAYDLCQNTDLACPCIDAQPLAFDAMRDKALALIHEIISVYRASDVDPTDRSHDFIRKILHPLEHILSQSQNDETGAFLRDLSLGKISAKQKGHQAKWDPKTNCAKYKALCEELNDILDLEGHRRTMAQNDMAVFFEFLEEFRCYYAATKRKDGCLSFHDLLVITRDLLKNNKDIRGYYQRKFRYLFVDEFQDTDPLQAEILFYLGEKNPQADRWEHVVLEPGKLFFVGDPKQSIYHFRRADITFYQRVKEIICVQGAYVEIRQCFRLAAELVEDVNRLFHPVMHNEDGSHCQTDYKDLCGGRATIATRTRLHCLQKCTEEGEEKPTVAQAVLQEAKSIAAAIRSIAADDTGQWVLSDQDGNVRKADYGDIAILYPKTTHIQVYEDLLKSCQIPYRIHKGKHFYHKQEIRDMLAMLEAINNPCDQVALVATLKSLFFGVSDEALFHFKQAGGQWDYRISSPVDVIESAFRVLRDLHEQKHVCRTSVLLQSVIARTHFFEILMLRADGRQGMANIQKMVHAARDFEQRHDGELRSFIKDIRFWADQMTAEAESQIVAQEDNCVTCMTCHSAKGLEFPIVIVAGLGSDRGSRANCLHKLIPNYRGGTFAYSLHGHYKTPDFDDMFPLELAKERAEDVRLLYVAMTRAKDFLILARFCRGSSRDDYDSLLFAKEGQSEVLEKGNIPIVREALPRIERQPYLFQRYYSQYDQMQKTDPAGLERLVHDREAWMCQRGHSAFMDVRHRILEPEPAAEALRQMRSQQFGLVFHACMEHLDFDHPESWPALVQAHLQPPVIFQDIQDIVRLITCCMASDLMRRVRKSAKKLREVPLAYAEGETMVLSRMDLLFHEGDGWVLVDYKVENYREGLAAHAHYTAQVCGYAAALRQHCSFVVKEVWLMYAGNGRAVELHV